MVFNAIHNGAYIRHFEILTSASLKLMTPPFSEHGDGEIIDAASRAS